MRILYIAGFFAPVLEKIQCDAKEYLDEKSVIWIPQRADKKGQLDINHLKSDLLDQATRGATHIHICCFVFRGQEHVLDSLNRIKDWALARHPGLNVTIEQFKNAQDSVSVLARISDFKPDRELAFPESLSEVETWSQMCCAGKLLLHPRAIRGAKESVYSDVRLAYQALILLAEQYRNLRKATPERRDACQQALQSKLETLGLELAPSITDTRAGEQGDDYNLYYPVGSERKRTLESHLKKGVDREQRNCLRIYFFWDSDNHVVVVGWLTSHLGTRAS